MREYWRNEYSLPEGIMEVGPFEPPSRSELEPILSNKVPRVLRRYNQMLEEDGNDMKRAELGTSAETQLEEHQEQLAELEEWIVQFAKNPSDFITTVQQVSQEDNSYRARFRKKFDDEGNEIPHGIPVGRENAQFQIAFFAQEKGGESERQITEAYSLRGVEPEAVIANRNRESGEEILQLNRLGVYRHPDTDRVKVEPEAGVRMVRIGDTVRLFGVKFVGTSPHFSEINNRDGLITSGDFSLAFSHSTQLAGRPREIPQSSS